MTLPPIDPSRAADLVARFADLPILVVGDVMLDRFIVGRVTRISPEAPVPVVRYQSEHVRLGGAANVAHNVAVLGGRASLVGIVGDDAAAAALRERLAAAGIWSDGLVADPGRPTTEKVRVVTERNQQVARIDYEGDDEMSSGVETAMIERVRAIAGGARAVLVSDYLKGAVTRSVMESISGESGSSRTSHIPIVVDPKIPHLDLYAGATVVTPNHHEAEAATHRPLRNDDDAKTTAHELRTRLSCDAVLITRGEHGMWLGAADAEGTIPAVAREVSDVTGAGDTVVATLALALGAGATLAEAAVLANHAAGIVVVKFGPATVARVELLESVAIG